MFHGPKRAKRGAPEIRLKSQKHAPRTSERAFWPRKAVMKTKCVFGRKNKNVKQKSEMLKNLRCLEGRWPKAEQPFAKTSLALK